ncbi:pilin [Patescibacteria group bacterium]|nr:pilin [Patescibacteria group bacterium]
MVGDVHEIKDLVDIVENIFNLVIRLAGILAFIMLLIGGFRYLTSGGDAKAAESARKTITYAILGLVLIIAAWFILKFIAEFTGLGEQLLKFEISQ